LKKLVVIRFVVKNKVCWN